MFYAEFCPYGIHTISDGDTLMAFETREERNEMVERINDAHSERMEGFVALVPRAPLAALILSLSLVFGYFGVSLFRIRAALRSSLKELDYYV